MERHRYVAVVTERKEDTGLGVANTEHELPFEARNDDQAIRMARRYAKRKHFGLARVYRLVLIEPKSQQGNPGPIQMFLDSDMRDWEISTRSYNGLANSGMINGRQLLLSKEHRLLQVKNFGKKSLIEIKERLLEPLGLRLGMTLEEINQRLLDERT